MAILILAIALPLAYCLVDIKELEYLRALDDSISYRVVFKPFDELPEQFLPSESTTISPTTASPKTTTAAQDPFSEHGKVQQQQHQDNDNENDGSEQQQQSQSLPLSSHPSPPPPSSSFSSSSATAEQPKLVKIVSADAEEYQCVLPVLASSSKKRIESYHGPSPAELIQSIYREQICSYRIEPYWNYELCHGRYVLQYHEDKESKKRTEYFLGNFVAMNAEVEARHFDQLNPPTRKMGDERLAYYPVTYTHGTVCDLTGKPRKTTVLYVCDEDARQNIHSINEVSSCHYEVIVLSREICAHPSFQPPPASEYEIRCYASAPTDESDELPPAAEPKPKAMQKLEEEQRNEFLGEYGLYRSSALQIAKNVMSKLLQAHLVDDDSLETSLNQWDAIFEAMKKAGAAAQQRGAQPPAGDERAMEPRGGGGAQGSSTPPHSPPTNSGAGPMSQALVDRFWRGDVCLQGGTGWWKHEVCLGRTVSQYHEETAEDGTKQRRQTILLGKFDEAVHKAWATEHPGKAVERKLDGSVVQVAHMYTQGDVCTETGAYRDCQVRMKCREDINAQKVFIYMLEPSTCSYVVVLESSLFCSKLQRVDEFGLLSVDEAAKASVAEKETAPEQQTDDRLMKKRTFGENTVVLDLANQEEIMRVVRQLLEGAGDGQVFVSAAKLKIGKGEDSEEDEEAEQQQQEGESREKAEAEHGQGSEAEKGIGREEQQGQTQATTDNETDRERVRSGAGTVQQRGAESVGQQKQEEVEARESEDGGESTASQTEETEKDKIQLIGHAVPRDGEL
ncbi:hypothetical protein niasHS_006440 [Heterodera schachtii]|uniref:Endoplasmic reticulum lectin 1 n=1 Tax=Heterodera schachtii TaxID=97005 RepID=A0ABD2JH92_HETSC